MADGNDRSRRMHQQRPQVRIAALGNSKLADPATGARLTRHETQPCRKFATRAEGAWIAHRRNGRRGSQHADSGDGACSFATRILLANVLEPAIDCRQLATKLADPLPLFAQPRNDSIRNAGTSQSEQRTPRSREPEPMRARKMTTEWIMALLSAGSSTA